MVGAAAGKRKLGKTETKIIQFLVENSNPDGSCCQTYANDKRLTAATGKSPSQLCRALNNLAGRALLCTKKSNPKLFFVCAEAIPNLRALAKLNGHLSGLLMIAFTRQTTGFFNTQQIVQNFGIRERQAQRMTSTMVKSGMALKTRLTGRGARGNKVVYQEAYGQLPLTHFKKEEKKNA